MSEKETIKSIVDKLGGKKQEFLKDVEVSIDMHISKKSWQECLTINQLYSSGNVKSSWSPEVSEKYFKRLSAFLRGKRYDGDNLDSKLTSGVVKLVTEKFNEFYSSNVNHLTKPLTDQLMKDQVFVRELANTIIEITKGPLPEEIKKQVTSHLIHILQDSAQTNIAHTIANATTAVVTKVVSTVVASSISSSVITAVLHQMALFLKTAIAKVLATTAFKTALAGIIKSMIKVKIVGALILIVGPALGAALGSVPLWAIVAPILAAFIAYQVSSLPKKMGEKVSVSVRDELSGKFEKLNNDFATQLLSSFTKDALSTLAKDIAIDLSHDDKFKSAFKNF